MTAFSHDAALKQLEREFDGFLSKPTSATHLYGEVAPLLGLAGEAPHQTGINALAADQTLRGTEVLLVEDTELNQEVLRDILESAGIRVRIANNGLEALEAIELARPACVLMDCQMPVMDGFEATRRLKAQARYRDLPVIALTANVMPSDRQRCSDAGMDGYLAKPVNISELFKALTLHVAATRGHGGGAAPALVAASPGESRATIPTSLPGIDTAVGLTQANGKPELYRKLLRGFRDQHGLDFEADFRLAIAAEDWETATRRAHSLKGVAKTIGAFGVGQIAADLEAATRDQNHEAISAALARLLPVLAQVRSGLLNLDSGAVPRGGPVAAVVELHPLLSQVLELLEQRDSSAADHLPALRTALLASGRNGAADSITAAMGRYDFAHAASLLKELLESK
jgi:CheY-like chemotaxis protein/HPt (histidine-containing phosphotransfer) domain-containing protein